MKRKLRAKLTYANVMVSILAFIVLGGGAAFAASNLLPKNSVGPAQLKRNAVTTAKVKRGAITGAKIKLSSLGAVPNAEKLGGLAAGGYQRGVMWALVTNKGTQIIAQSGGISIQAQIKGGTWLHFPAKVAGKAIVGTPWESDEFSDPVVQAAPCGFVSTAQTPDSVACVKGTNTTSDMFVGGESKGAAADVSFYVAVIP